jgi:hypothetical protein
MGMRLKRSSVRFCHEGTELTEIGRKEAQESDEGGRRVGPRNTRNTRKDFSGGNGENGENGGQQAEDGGRCSSEAGLRVDEKCQSFTG